MTEDALATTNSGVSYDIGAAFQRVLETILEFTDSTAFAIKSGFVHRVVFRLVGSSLYSAALDSGPKSRKYIAVHEVAFS